MVDQTNTGESDYEITENPDGSASLVEKKSGESEESKDFYRNLAKELTEEERALISTTLVELIEKDIQDRKRRDEQVAEGKKRMGLEKETIGGANFSGASHVTHPMYTKASIDFEARTIKELFPPGGPVREYMAGSITTDRLDRSRRKARWMNYQLTQLMPNFRSECEQMLMNLPMDGDEYMKLIPPPAGGDIRNVTHEWIPVDDMILPYAATNYYTAERRTHVQKMTAQEFQRRIRTGMYRAIEEMGAPIQPEETETQQVISKVEGKESDNSNPDGLRVVYECDCYFEIRDSKKKGSHTESLQEDVRPDESGETAEEEATEVGPLPYLISIDVTTKELLAVYRNWEESDNYRERLDWAAEFPFIPFRGAYALGLPHIIGGLSIAATGALRALLDSAHINNLAGMIKIKSAAGTGQNIRVGPTEVTEIEGSGDQDDIRKIIMPVPFGPPSPVLLNLLGLLGEQAEDVIRTTIEEAQANGDVPVGTTLARIEQGMVAFSAIHGRMHNAMDRLLKILHRINKTWLDDHVVTELLGEQLVTQKDFEGPNDVIPVSDPNIFCEVQRYGQIQTVAQRALQLAVTPGGAGIYDMRKVEELILKQMKLPNDGKDLLVQKPEPQQMNPINENVAVCLGRPIVAFPQQDHEAHIQAHCDFYENPFFSAVVSSNPQAMQGLMGNLKEHVIFWYATKVHQIASEHATQVAKSMDPQAGEVDIGELPQHSQHDPQLSQLYDQMLAKTSTQVMQLAQQDQTLQRAIQTMGKIQQALQAMLPPPMMDPSHAQMASVQQKAKQAEQEHADRQQANTVKQQDSQGNQQTKLAIAREHEQAETARTQMKEQAKQIQTQQQLQADMHLEGQRMSNEMQVEGQRMAHEQQSMQMEHQARQQEHQDSMAMEEKKADLSAQQAKDQNELKQQQISAQKAAKQSGDSNG
jgi:hypothetical protein